MLQSARTLTQAKVEELIDMEVRRRKHSVPYCWHSTL